MKVLWCVCGAEYLLKESVETLTELEEVDVAYSLAGEQVAKMYGFSDDIESHARKVIKESGEAACCPTIMKLKDYGCIVVAPCTANTVAKIAHGIADTLVTNVVSQGLKAEVKVVVLPTDAEEEVEGVTVSGEKIRIKCRSVDLDNVEKIKGEVEVAENAKDLVAFF